MIKIGDYAFERYRMIFNKEGIEIKQGMGLKGIVSEVIKHKYTKEWLVRFSNNKSYDVCEMKWVTTDEKLAVKIIGALNVL